MPATRAPEITNRTALIWDPFWDQCLDYCQLECPQELARRGTLKSSVKELYLLAPLECGHEGLEIWLHIVVMEVPGEGQLVAHLEKT